MKIRLVSLDRWLRRSKIVLKNLPATLGRGEEATVQLADRWVSRVHCLIEAVDGTVVVRDLGSSNGTLVNGNHIQESPLLPGDRLTLGMTTYVAAYEGPLPAAVQLSGAVSAQA